MRVHLCRNGHSPERARSARSWVGAALGCACILSACGRTSATAVTDRPAPVRGIARISGTPPVAAANANEDQAPLPAPVPLVPPADEAAQPARADQAAQAAPSAAEPEAAAEPKARDFSAELARLVGDPSGCLEPRASDDTLRPIEISIRSQVMPSGAVGRAEVGADALGSSERRCITQRVESVHFAPPIEGAPLSVSTQISLRPAAAPRPATARAPGDSRPTPAPSAAPEANGGVQPTAAEPARSTDTSADIPQPSAADSPTTEAAPAQPSHEDGSATAD